MPKFDTESTEERVIINFNNNEVREIIRLGRYTYSHPHAELVTHSHEGIMEICYLDKGLQIYEVSGKEYQIKGGEIFITFPNELHSTSGYPEERGVLYWLQLKITQNDQFLRYKENDAKVFLNQLLNIPSRHFKVPPSVKKILEDIINFSKKDVNPFNRIIIANKLIHFLINVIQCGKEGSSKYNNPDKCEQIKKYIEENICDNISIKTLAGRLYFSESHFKNWFKKEFGMTPIDYVLRLKIEKAKLLLANNRQSSITNISYQLNFSSPQYFSTVFKKYVGITPAGFRNG